MIVFEDPAHRLHHPVDRHMFGGSLLPPAEIPDRSDRIIRALEAAGGFEMRRPTPIDSQLLTDVHTERYLEFLKSAHTRWRSVTNSPENSEAVAYIRPLEGTPWKEPKSVLAQMGRFSNDVDPILAGTWTAALAAAACAANAADVAEREGVAYALSRPPGHHAAPEAYGGYCYLNNTAIAAAHFLRRNGRVAVVDVDTHHGNGTQTVFWKRPDVLTISIHGDPDEHYPFFLGYADEVGADAGEGYNRNFPLPTGARWPSYEESLKTAMGLVGSFGADCLVVALGVDTYAGHGVISLEGDDYRRLGETLATAAIPTVFVQEGGYVPSTLERAVPAVFEGFLNGI